MGHCIDMRKSDNRGDMHVEIRFCLRDTCKILCDNTYKYCFQQIRRSVITQFNVNCYKVYCSSNTQHNYY